MDANFCLQLEAFCLQWSFFAYSCVSEGWDGWWWEWPFLGRPDFSAKALENTAFSHEKMQNRGAPKRPFLPPPIPIPPSRRPLSVLELFCLQFELVCLQLELFRLQLSFFTYSGKVRLINTLTDCKQRSSTVSKKAPTVSKKLPRLNSRDAHRRLASRVLANLDGENLF